MSRNIHINLFKHRDGLSLCLSKAEKGESSAYQTHPDDTSRFLFYWQTVLDTIQLILTSSERRTKEEGKRKKVRGRQGEGETRRGGDREEERELELPTLQSKVLKAGFAIALPKALMQVQCSN